MREIVFDTETTGLEAEKGDRLVEIGAVELFNHLPTGRTFHKYINPQRPVPAEVVAIHGLDDAFLRDKPVFAQIADEFVAFIGTDAKLVAHNASFDLRFINAELGRTGHPPLTRDRIIDSLQLARDRFPGANNTLDGLCRRFGVDNSNRTLHGALLDSELLAEVYLELIGGRQPGLELAPQADAGATGPQDPANPATPTATLSRPRPLPPRLSQAEAEAHKAFVDSLGEGAIWTRFR